MSRRFVVCPDFVTSRTDGDVHYIGAAKLARLYELRPDEYYVWHQDVPAARVQNWETQGLMFLCPRRDGKYGRPS